MTLAFRAYDASRCDYPRPRLPPTPPLEAASFGLPGRAKQPTCFGTSDQVMFTRGRYALLHGLRAFGVGPADSVLIPAYHCRTMIDPVVRLGARPCFYPLNADLAPDLERLSAVAASAAQPPKALLLPHYFGYPQDVESIAAFCSEHRIALIEDCCHAYFGSAGGRVLGSRGDCAIASASKFFPCEDGGELIMRRPISPTAPPRRRALADELRSAYRVAEGAWSSMKWRFSLTKRLRTLDGEFDQMRRRYPRWDSSSELTEPALSHQYQIEMEQASALSLSRWLIRTSDATRICDRRRRNYAALLEGVRSLPRCRPLFAQLPEGVVPYMFPLLIEQPEHRFHWLKHLGVPMYRWDELAVSECAVSNHYRLHLVHLPCHQALRDGDLAWILRALSLAMSADVEEHARATGTPCAAASED